MSILGTGVSGLLAFQRALSTTGHNIANAATEGYTRQRVDFSTRTPQFTGGYYVGQGVTTDGIRRIQDDLVDARLRTSLSDNGYGSVRAEYAERVDSLLADATTGMAPVLENYFAAVQDVADDPTAIAARTALIGEADSLSARFARVNGEIQEQRDLLNGEIRSSVDEINQITAAIAELNTQIVTGDSRGSQPNDLLDQRDLLLNQLAEKVDLNTTVQDDGSVNVFVGNGQALVTGGNAAELVARSFSGDGNIDVGLKTSGGDQPVDISRFMTGGELGAMLETRTGILDEAQNTLGFIALNLGAAFNQQHTLGVDRDGNLGGELFAIPEPDVYPTPGNAASGQLEVTLEDVSELTPNDYRLRFTGSAYRLETLPDGTDVPLTPDSDDPDVLTGGGLRIDTGDLSGAASRDQWLIQPTRGAADSLEVLISDPEKIAAAGAMVADAGDLNAGAVQIASVVAVDGDDPRLLNSAVVGYNGYGYTLNGVELPPSAISVDEQGFTTISANGWALTLDGTPEVGDEFSVAGNGGVDIVLGEGNLRPDVVSRSVIDTTDPDLLDEVVIEFDGTDYTLDGVALTPPDLTTLPSGNIQITANGWQLELQNAWIAGDRFTVGGGGTLAVTPDAGNTGTAAVLESRVTDPEADFSTASTLAFNGTNYVLDGTVLPNSAVEVAPDGNTTTITANGWALTLDSQPAAGDQFDIGGLAEIAVYPDPANGVSAAEVRVTDSEHPRFADTVELSYDATTFQYSLDGVPLPTSAVSGSADGQVTIAANGWEVTLERAPNDGEVFEISGNVQREGDNRNMLELTRLQDARTLEGDESIQNGYNSLISEVGTQTRQAQIVRDASATQLESAQAQRESISGVNLDEEAANLLRYQQAYQASAQVIATTSTLFDTLINAVRR
ncbi:flagellar hook protein FlgK [Marichromatium purpuratum 984]|uniref:Flagellar hook-associated protein 1 n=1 Tax=Marichromatium purpuratum 984 TaxID=765910 RepID=W0DZ12_MARPU|nr:flagellar hook-associated protein FlgK [Marichromatium purpuratum]AHF03667.1 flagellar hook protein FlgK [Marichromatium purpuratum 984]